MGVEETAARIADAMIAFFQASGALERRRKRSLGMQRKATDPDGPARAPASKPEEAKQAWWYGWLAR